MLCFNDQNIALTDEFTDFIIWTSSNNVSLIKKTLKIKVKGFNLIIFWVS